MRAGKPSARTCCQVILHGAFDCDTSSITDLSWNEWSKDCGSIGAIASLGPENPIRTLLCSAPSPKTTLLNRSVKRRDDAAGPRTKTEEARSDNKETIKPGRGVDSSNDDLRVTVKRWNAEGDSGYTPAEAKNTTDLISAAARESGRAPVGETYSVRMICEGFLMEPDWIGWLVTGKVTLEARIKLESATGSAKDNGIGEKK
uniref:Phage tail protein n=1 Tax=Steinernema glaseri TaxID=37863 RepID=A0A1I8A9K6_9BILA